MFFFSGIFKTQRVYFGYGLITSTMICSGMLDITVRRDAVLGQ